MTAQTYSLYHPTSGATVKFTPKGETVSVVVHYGGLRADMASTLSVADARAVWKVWLGVGALDCRKHVVHDGRVFAQHSDGRVSYKVIENVYEYYNQTRDSAAVQPPPGYRYDTHDCIPDDTLDRDEKLVQYFFTPERH